MVLPIFFYPIFLVKIFCFAIFAASFNFLLGFTGIVSFGQAALFGTAAYVTAYALKPSGRCSQNSAILAGIAAATLLWPGDGSLGHSTPWHLSGNDHTLGRADGLFRLPTGQFYTWRRRHSFRTPRPTVPGLIDLSDDRAVYGLAAIALCGVFLGLRRLLASRLGMMFVAIRDDERRALSLGHNVELLKLAAFGIASFCAGLAGALSALAFQLATLSGAHWHLSSEAVLMALIGGIGTLTGPLVGAAVLVTMQHFLAPFGAWVLLIQGLIFAFCVLVFRDGLVPRVTSIWAKCFGSNSASAVALIGPLQEGGRS